MQQSTYCIYTQGDHKDNNTTKGILQPLYNTFAQYTQIKLFADGYPNRRKAEG